VRPVIDPRRRSQSVHKTFCQGFACCSFPSPCPWLDCVASRVVHSGFVPHPSMVAGFPSVPCRTSGSKWKQDARIGNSGCGANVTVLLGCFGFIIDKSRLERVLGLLRIRHGIRSPADTDSIVTIVSVSETWPTWRHLLSESLRPCRVPQWFGIGPSAVPRSDENLSARRCRTAA